MKNNKYYITIFLIILFILSSLVKLKAQDVKGDFEKANLALLNEKELSFDITYSFYCSSEQSKPTESEKGRYSKNADSYYSFSYGVETICSENLLLMINVKEKSIMISNKKKILPYAEISESIEKTLKYCKKTEFVEVGNEKIYNLIIKNFGIEKIEIHLRKSDLFLLKIVFFQNEKANSIKNGKTLNCKNPKTEILFSNIIKKSNLETDKLAIKNYIIKQKDGSFKAVGVYENFKLLDLRNNKKKQ